MIKLLQTYHKIECPFERSLQGSKELLWNHYRNSAVEYLRNNTWVFTEKVDGTNIRIFWDGYNIQILGRKENSLIPEFLGEQLNQMFLTDEVEQLFEQQFGNKEVILFGEGYGNKIQDVGSKYRKDNSFILFDVMVNGNYQPRDVVENIAKMFDIDIVPIVIEGTIYDAIEYVMSHPKSIISKEDVYMEGLVGHPLIELKDRCGNRVITKIKWRDFKKFAEEEKYL